jgi:hypothetical protein
LLSGSIKIDKKEEENMGYYLIIIEQLYRNLEYSYTSNYVEVKPLKINHKDY